MSPRRCTWQPTERDNELEEIGKKVALICVGLLAAVVLAVIAWVLAYRLWQL
jgi:hypothetical protein